MTRINLTEAISSAVACNVVVEHAMVNYCWRAMKSAMGKDNQSLIKVECYAGYRGEETPLRFYLGERCIEVLEVLDRWIDPDCRYFKLLGDDNGIYILRHTTDRDVWEMTLYDSNTRNNTRLSST